MPNLLNETLDVLKQNKIKQSEVLYVQDNKSYCSFEEFKIIADIEYDDDFGIHEINSNLMVVGKDWWLERREYDGAEWWEFKKIPKKPKSHKAALKILE